MISATPPLFVFEQVSSLKCQNTFYKNFFVQKLYICINGKKVIALKWTSKVKMNFDQLPQHSFIIDFLSSVAMIKTTLIQLRCSMFSCYDVACKMACQSRVSKLHVCAYMYMYCKFESTMYYFLLY